ncbi:NADH dehydrogenase [ubiquinone] 1 alpha subcomplex subunit 2 [Nasonia vitripennis]|uniref:NADH dehydrogenase [ubiquinone] 1 alpha subcomplex subunit 2 n=1 Tax=Nasonia vitripennis TaxID=7425 RepID=A0A7M6UVE9_NASVI|nr:NADH dehydrogenase [ubiquinone] 1 alpha subcomplex subunit 2 [Nasonia vitripennis]
MAAARLSSKIKELRILLCQTSKSSEGVRNFIENHYVSLKKANPQLPIMIRECSQIEPRLFVRVEYGKEKCYPLSNLKVDDVLQKFQQATSNP